MNTAAHDLIAAGDPQAALEMLQKQVREHAGDVKLRVFLFQLLCVLGQWERASSQLQLCGEMDASTLPMVNTYREALQCELVREAVFAGKTSPMVFGQPQAWAARLVEALQADARGEGALAQRLRADAFDAAPATSGSLGGIAFEWIADADSRLGPMLEAVINGRYGWVPFSALAKVAIEAPTDLRDLVWAPAHLDFVNGGEAVALIPARYAGSGAERDGALQLARKTEWLEIGADQYRGLGQRVLTTSASELGLLEVRDIVLEPSLPADVLH
jgi:type VI secretion system protein ImpE